MTKTDPAAEPSTASGTAAAPGVSLEERPLTYDELVTRKGELNTQALLMGLRDGRAMVRANAALGLAALGHAGRDLVPFLRDSHPVAARAAGEALAHLGLAQRAHLAVIAGALDGARREVVDSVVTMFALFIGPADADLINVLDTGDSLAVDAVVEACARAGLRGLQLLQAATRDERARVRLNAVGGVGRIAHIEPVSSVEVMRRAADSDEVSDVRVAALTAIAKFMARNRLEVAAQRKQAGHRSLSSVPALHARALTPDELRAAAAVAPLDELLHALLDERVEVRLNAVRVLALQGAAAAGGAPTLAVVTRDPEATVRAEAARALGAIGAAGVAAAPALVRALGDDEAAVIAAAEAALADQGAAAAPVLVEGLLVSDEAHGARVAALIGRLADGPSLLREALASTSLDVRINAARGLGALGKERAGAALPSLYATKSGGNARVRAAVASAIAQLDPKPDHTPPPIAIEGFAERVLTDAELAKGKAALVAVGAAGLVPRLADARAVVRANAALALAMVGDAPGVVDALAVCLRDDAAEVRLAAARAFERLGEAAVAARARDLVRALGGADAALAAQLTATLRAHAHPAVAAALVGGLDTTDADHARALCALVVARPDGIDLLAAALASASADLQVNAAHGLAALGPDRAGAALPALVAAKSDGNATVRAAVAKAIAQLDPRPEPTLPPIAIDGFGERVLTDAELAKGKAALTAAGAAGLVPRLGDARAAVRANAALALGVLGDAPGVADALAVGLRDDAAEVRMAAARALERLGEAAVAARAHDLVRSIGGPDAALAAQATAMLRAHAHPAIAAALVRGLDTTDEEHALALCELLCARPAGLDLLCAALGSTSADVQRNAARGLGALGKDRGAAAVPALTAARSGASAPVRAAITRALATLDPRPTPTLPPIALDGFEQRALTEAELTKGKAALAAAGVAGLVPRLADGRAAVRANAALALGIVGGDAATLAVCLRDDDAEVRLAAARALERLGEAAVVTCADDLVRALGRADAPLAAQLATVLRAHAHPAIAAALVRGLDTTDSHLGLQLAELLCARPAGVAVLSEALTSASADVQLNAALGLGALGKAGAAALPALVAAKSSEYVRVRAAVAAAIEAIDPKPDQTLAPIAIDGFGERVLTDAELTKGKAALAAAGVAGLVPRLADANPAVRANAALALGTVGGDAPGVVDALAVCLRDDDAAVRMGAARALDRLGEAAVATCADELVRALGRADGPLAAQLATMLRAHPHAAIAAALVRGLETSNPALALQLCELVWARPTGIDLLCEAFARPAAQANVARGFVMLGKDRLGKGRAVLESTRTAGSPRAREIARATLYAIDGPPPPPPVPAVPGFETELLEHRAFAKIGVLEAHVLLAFVADGRAVVRANAATGVGALGPSAAAHALTIAALLRDDDDRVRVAAARALDQLGDDAVIAAAPNLVGALGGHAGVADVCGGVLAARKGKVEAALVAGLETSDEVHGTRVAELIAALPNARELLFAAFDGEAQNVQINAAFGIGKLGTKRAGPEGRGRLLSGLPGPPTRRRSAMVKALELLGPEPKR